MSALTDRLQQYNGGPYDPATNPHGFDGAADGVTGFEANLPQALNDIGAAAAGMADTVGTIAVAQSTLAMSWDAATADANPGAGKLRASTASLTSGSCTLYISTTDAAGGDATSTLAGYGASTSTIKGRLRLVKVGDAAKYVDLDVTGVTVATGYRKVTVAYVAGPGGFTAGDPVALGFVRTGDTTHWLSGAGAPSAGAGNNGDQYLNVANGDVYAKAAGSWGAASGNIRGPAGTDGINGSGGTVWYGTSGGTANAQTLSGPLANLTGHPSVEFVAGVTNGSVTRTNSVLQSADFATTWATFSGATVTANSTTAPDGTTTADTISGGTGAGVNQSITVPADTTTRCYSIHLKAGTSSACRLQLNHGTAQAGIAVDLTTGTVTTWFGTPLSAGAKPLPGGWWRVSFGLANTSGTTCVPHIFPVQGSGSGTVYAWGAQVETGSAATPYIATTTASVSVTDGHTTLTVGTTAETTLLDAAGRALVPGAVTYGTKYVATYDGAYWRLVNSLSPALNSLTVKAGALGGNTNDEMVTETKTGTVGGNTDNLITRLLRVVSGTDWTTAAWEIRRRVDASDMAFIRWGGGNDVNRLGFGSGAVERFVLNVIAMFYTAVRVQLVTLTPVSNVFTMDCALGNDFDAGVIGASCTFANPINPPPAGSVQSFSILTKQDATGNRAFSYGSNWIAMGNTAANTGANKYNTLVGKVYPSGIVTFSIAAGG